MKLMLLAAVALPGLMEEANDGSTGSSGGAATETNEVINRDAPADTFPQDKPATDIADTSGDVAGEPAGAHLDRAAKGEEPAAVAAVDAEPSGDQYADACKAGAPIVALVGKAGDRISVQLTSVAHLERLQAEHGDVEVQS